MRKHFQQGVYIYKDANQDHHFQFLPWDTDTYPTPLLSCCLHKILETPYQKETSEKPIDLKLDVHPLTSSLVEKIKAFSDRTHSRYGECDASF